MRLPGCRPTETPMTARTTLLPLAGALLLGHVTACSAPKPEPEIASAAPQGGYAMNYPEALSASATGFSSTQNEIRTGIKEFKEYPSKLKDPGWARVHEILKSADAAGRSHVYV